MRLDEMTAYSWYKTWGRAELLASLPCRMPYPDKKEFLALLREGNHEQVVEEYLLHGLPFAFKDDAPTHGVLLAEISKELVIEQDSINVIGSGRIGFSLAPEKFGNPFSAKSDLDVAIANADLFDQAWMDMLKVGRAYFSLKPGIREWIKTHRQSLIFWGIVRPDTLPGVVGISSKWFSTFKGLSRNRVFASRQVTGRLYRTRDHLLVHQMYSCSSIVASARK
jgi:hypothetical protein